MSDRFVLRDILQQTCRSDAVRPPGEIAVSEGHIM